MIRKALVIPYFGEWPEWFDLYLYSLGNNPSLDVIFYTDIPTEDLLYVPNNAKFVKVSLKDYCKQASDKLGITFSPSNPYKLCDLKPFYPIIHQDELKEYDYIGWGDIDLLYGNLDRFFPDTMLSKYEIISTQCYIFSGHFMLLKNKPEIYQRVFNIPNWKEMLVNKDNCSMDEIQLTRALVPRLNYLRNKFWKLGRGEYSKSAIRILATASKIIYPKYHLKELWTTPKYIDGKRFFWHSGEVYDETGLKLPYIHFLFFKKTIYNPANCDYWKEGFYEVEANKLNNNSKIIIDKLGIKVYD